MDENGPNFELPGFRFKPTEEELLSFYLKNVVYNKKMHLSIIGFLNIYQHAPWDLPGLAKIGEREWYFFVLRDLKHGCGRPNRTTEHGFWKATGSDRKIVTFSEPKRVVGLRKTLVFYKGRAPRGTRTDWVMNEYRLPDTCDLHKEIVLCKVYRKATSLKELEERAAKEEAMDKSLTNFQPKSYPTSPISSLNGTTSFISDLVSDSHTSLGYIVSDSHTESLKKEVVEETNYEVFMSANSAHEIVNPINNDPAFMTPTSRTNYGCNNIKLPFGKDSLGELQVPKMGFELGQDSNFSQSLSPWLENLLNFSSPTLFSQLFT